MQCDVLPNFSISSTLKKFNLKSKPGGLDLSWRGLHRDSWSRHCQDVSLDARENLNSFKKLVSTMYNLNRFQKLILTVETPRLNEMSTIYNIDGRHFRFRDFGSERWCRGKINISWSQWRLLDCWDFSIVETSRLSRLLDCWDKLFEIVEIFSTVKTFFLPVSELRVSIETTSRQIETPRLRFSTFSRFAANLNQHFQLFLCCGT